MARISRRNLIKTEETKVVSSFRAGIYTRLSQERTEEWRSKSSSIETQIEICQEYANKENMVLVKVYTDYEYSGTNFDRPGYIEMMDDVRNGLINCIIIRDLSRLGREHLEMGRLVDKVFPFLGVRFISVVDKIDTERGIDAKLSFEMLIKNLINDMYAKDIGQKIKTSKTVNAKQGFFIGSNPPFGYRVVEKDGGRKLEPDEVSKKIIERIFTRYVAGENTLKIAKELNEDNISTSSAYNKTGNILREPGEPQWRKGTIANMLRQRVYTGCLVQGTKENVPGKKSGHYRQKPKDEWIIVEDTHEAIIPKDLFIAAQERLDNNKEKDHFKITRHDLKREPINKYKGLIFDGNTKLILKRNCIKSRKKNAKFYYYKFTNEENNGVILETSYISIMEEDLDRLVINKLRNVLSIDASGADCKDRIIDISKMKIEVVEKHRISLSLKISKLNSELKKLYESYSLGKLEKEEYLEERIINRNRLNTYEKELSNLDLEILSIEAKAEEELELFDYLTSYNDIKLDEEIIPKYIDRIDVYDNETIKISLKGYLAGKEMKSNE
ncbi:recombinase family protein [Clostridium algidicarnis]|uniref:recombinase family protein n=1 Tax=Clostridium algidicarnis TaxID=37659 RepID=UPI001C0CA039|nr:recombinase family protein [Clostridium algidicarnis]MBU3194629.1 recombinase family protein [Clostridium algidicarnis]MBU3207934.1 recombinase family protein [Clostridium algidicarnis]